MDGHKFMIQCGQLLSEFLQQGTTCRHASVEKVDKDGGIGLAANFDYMTDMINGARDGIQVFDGVEPCL